MNITIPNILNSTLGSTEKQSIDREPKSDQITINSEALKQEIEWFNRILEARLQLYFENDCPYTSIYDISVPSLESSRSDYGLLVKKYKMTVDERIILILSLIPHLQPQLLNLLLINDPLIGKPYVEFGGWRGKIHQGFLPTGETAAFIIAGNDISHRLKVFSLLKAEHFFSAQGLLDIHPGEYVEAYLTAPLVISREYFNQVTIGKIEKPDFSMHFPAKLLETNLEWRDLVLPNKVLEEVENIHIWLRHQHFIQNEMGFKKSIKPGYRALFFGPPGTGKTLTASLLGKSMNMDVYRIELSSVVSKYIGETEKNLETIFQQAENRQWILFFDEADALFGKRSDTQSSNDRHANQEVAYLLQRIEEFPGVVILATNLKSNIDDAFLRRFQSMIFFPVPDPLQRQILWEKALNKSEYVASEVDVKELSKSYELAGGSIINVIRYAAIASLRNGSQLITQKDLLAGVAKEQRKQGRII
jgi:DNA polymerase III delta prime subunit